jgi:hypothetical protein
MKKTKRFFDAQMKTLVIFAGLFFDHVGLRSKAAALPMRRCATL